MAILWRVISLLIILALVTVPLLLIARLSLTVMARLLGVVSQSEVATRAEFDRIREQLLATATVDAQSVATQTPAGPPREGTPGRLLEQGAVDAVDADEHQPARWRDCPGCATTVPSTARVCLRCGYGLA